MTLRLEYRYFDLGTFCADTCTSPSSNALINLHPTFQSAQLE